MAKRLTGWIGGKRVKACKKKDLTKMSFRELVRFCTAAVSDWPIEAMTQGSYIEGRNQYGAYSNVGVVHKDDDDEHAVAIFNMPLNPKTAKVCAVGAILACDGAAAAFDVLGSHGTGKWKSGSDADSLFSRIIDAFDNAPDVADGQRRALILLKEVRVNIGKRVPPGQAIVEADNMLDAIIRKEYAAAEAAAEAED